MVKDNSPAAKKAAKEAQLKAAQEETATETLQQDLSTDTVVAEPTLVDAGFIQQTNYVRNRQELAQIEDFNLPPHVTSWDIVENPYNPETTILIFYTGDEATTYVEVNIENLEHLMLALNEQIILLGETDISGWAIRTPEDPTLPPLLSLSSGGAVVATIALEKELLKELVPSLLKIYDPNKGDQPGLIQWAKKHYIISGFFTLMFTGLTISSIANIFI